MKKMEDLNEIKHKLIDAVKMEIAAGIENVDTEELGAVVDMIKDLAEAEESCMEAAYYENVTEAMENYEQDGGEGRMGYDRWRYSSGRFAPKGRGHVSGYMPPYMNDGEMPEVMGYTNGRSGGATTRSNGTNGTMSTRMGNMPRYGYHGEPKEQMEQAIDTMGDIWADADTEMREKMKTHVKDLLYQMEQN